MARTAVLAACLALVAASVGGCETTQEKATKQQARAAHILRERARREKAKKAHGNSKKNHQEGKK